MLIETACYASHVNKQDLNPGDNPTKSKCPTCNLPLHPQCIDNHRKDAHPNPLAVGRSLNQPHSAMEADAQRMRQSKSGRL